MKFLIASLASTLLTISLLVSLQNNVWVHESSLYTCTIGDTIYSKTYLRFSDDKVLFKNIVEDRSDSMSFDLIDFTESGKVFRFKSGQKKNDLYFYGYLNENKDKLLLAPSDRKLDLHDSLFVRKTKDFHWMEFYRSK